MKHFVVRSLLTGLMLTGSWTSGAGAASMKGIVNTYAKSAIRRGEAVGVGVAVISGPGKPSYFTFGRSFVSHGARPSRRFGKHDLFEIGSVTKVFTTNLFGQAVYKRQVNLDTPLSRYATQLGTVRPLTSQMTLLQLADFTAGVPTQPRCNDFPIPGCLTSGRPTIQEYTAADFARYFRNMQPLNFAKNPPELARSLPAPYNYSDFAVGLLGLLLTSRNQPLSNADLDRWHQNMQENLLTPLGMSETFLFVPPDQLWRRAGGYQQALAKATVRNGRVAAVTLTSHGALYHRKPRVRLRGGGGTGARATATVTERRVSQIRVTNGGHGYVTPASVIFRKGGSKTEAEAHVIVKNGSVIAVAVSAGGEGYVRTPKVKITGGRAASGREATATAHLINGRVGYITVDDPGAAYVEPLSVVIEPGGAIENAVPIWAPAGALTTSLRDLARFTRAALLSPRRPGRYPTALARGFRLAERPYACTGSAPALSTCPKGANRSAMSWALQPADPTSGVPRVISKNGGLSGFSTLIILMPDVPLAVVVMVNSRSPSTPSEESHVAGIIGNNILYALFACGSKCW